MLYLLYRGNHPALTYHGGQDPIMHLEADLHSVVKWAESANRRWAFSLSNAGASYTQFHADLNDMSLVDWDAIASNDFSSVEVKEGKQAEFLVHESFPWTLIDRIGVRTSGMKTRIDQIIVTSRHKPVVSVRQGWYF